MWPEALILPRGGNPSITNLTPLVPALQADACTLGLAEFDCGIHQLLQNRLGFLHEGSRETTHAFQLVRRIAEARKPVPEAFIAVEVQHFQTSVRQVS